MRSEAALKVLWDADAAEDLFKQACDLVHEVTGGNMDRDHVRREAITDAIVAKFRPKQNP